MKPREFIPGKSLGAQLRSGVPELVEHARSFIDDRGREAGAQTEQERARAIRVKDKTWWSWLNEGLVARLPNPRARKSPDTDPIKFHSDRHWIRVEWVPHTTPSLRARGRTVALVTTSAGGKFSLSTTEGRRFVKVLESVGWAREPSESHPRNPRK